jgi:hypothetical protein
VFWCSFINGIPVRNLFTSHIVDFIGTETPGKCPLNLLDFFPSCKEVSSVLLIREQSNNLSHNKPAPPSCTVLTFTNHFLDSGPLKMGPIGRPETSVRNYHYSPRNSPEERSSHLLRGGMLRSHTYNSRLLCTD